MEEDIKIVQSIIDNTKESIENNKELTEKQIINRTVAYRAIEHLISSYKKIEEENKNLRDKESDYTTVYMTGLYDERKKWKQKIKDKIEELENKFFRQTYLPFNEKIYNDNSEKYDEILGNRTKAINKIEILQKLLKED